ncbi:unnamed protein product [Trichobilharzia szidati]|nr:unnamed protein product [Trichobilharzia szidati]
MDKIHTSSCDPIKRSDEIVVDKNTDSAMEMRDIDETTINKQSSDGNIVLRKSHVKTIPASELVQQQFIGSGAFGKVYRGLWRGQDIALKMFDLATSQVDNEALHLCRLSHRNIVKFYGICRLDNSNFPALVMEYAYGGSLSMVLSQRPSLGPLILLDWALQIANGMAYLHSDARICHRDLKSSNILIREPIKRPFSTNELQGCTLLITDFGMACRSSQLAPQQSKLGTVAYAAPEVCRQEGFSFKSDIWSYGVVLWELLTLDVPFRAMEQPRLLFIIAMYNYTLHIPQGVPDLFVQLFKDCWSPTPTSRPTFENIIARLESCKDCSFVDLEPSELAQIQQGWRELIAAHHNEEQQSVAEALSSSFKSGSLDFTSELLTQLELLRNYRESLDRVKADLVERAHQLHMKEELYNRMAGTMGQHFMLLAVLAANHLKDPTHTNQVVQPKPPPPRKRPFVRSLFRRWGSNGNPSTEADFMHQGAFYANSLHGKDRKRSVNYAQPNRSHFDVNTNNATDSNSSVFDDTLPSSSRRVGCSQGGIPLISPPTDMKHVVHVDSDWFTGQGLCESTMRLFPSATFTNSPIGLNIDRCRDASLSSCYGSQIRPFTNTKSDSDVAEKSNMKSLRLHSCGNTVTDLQSNEQRYANAQTNCLHFQRNFNRLPRKSNLVRKFENKNNLDFLQKSSNHSVGFSNFFTPFTSYQYEMNNCNECFHNLTTSNTLDNSDDCINVPLNPVQLNDDVSAYGPLKTHFTVSPVQHDSRRNQLPEHNNSKVTQPKFEMKIPMQDNSNSPLNERRRSASGPVASYDLNAKCNDYLVNSNDRSSLSGMPNDLLYMICNPTIPLLRSDFTGQPSRKFLSTVNPPAIADFHPDLNYFTEDPHPSKGIRNSVIENVLMSAFRLAASFCFCGVEPDIDDAKVNALIPYNPKTISCVPKFRNTLNSNTHFDSQSNLNHSKYKSTTKYTGNALILSGQNAPNFRHVSSGNSVYPIDKRKYKFSIQDTRRIQSADRCRNSKHSTSSACPVCVNMGLDSINPCEALLDHQAEFGDPHSPFLGMLAGSGRRPNVNRTFMEVDNSDNSVFSEQHKLISNDKKENYFTYTHEDLPEDNNHTTCKTHCDDGKQRPAHFSRHSGEYKKNSDNNYNNNSNSNHLIYGNSCNEKVHCCNQKELYEKNKSTGKLNCAFRCSHLSVCIDCCQNIQNKNVELTSNNSRTILPHILTSSHLTHKWSLDHTKTLDNNNLCSPSNSFISSRKFSSEYQPSVMSVDKCPVPESSGVCISSPDSQYCHFSVSMNPVGVSRDAYLKATQDGFLNRTVYEPAGESKFCYSSYSSQTSRTNSLKRSDNDYSFSNSAYSNIHDPFLNDDPDSESESDLDQYGNTYQLDYSSFILRSTSSSPVNSNLPQNPLSPSSKLQSNISENEGKLFQNLNPEVHGGADEEDRITLVPIDSEETNNTIQNSLNINGSDSRKIFVGTRESDLLPNKTTKKVLHRSQAIRERHRPPFLTLFRNRSLPNCADNESPSSESRSFLICPSDGTMHEEYQCLRQSQGSESPCGPFVSLHSTFL